MSKKPKTVEIGDQITQKEYERFFTYGINSSTWYITTYGRSSSETIDRLFKKGYPKHSTTVLMEDDTTEDINIAEKIIDQLESTGILNDSFIVKQQLQSTLNSNKSMSQTLRKLKMRGISEEIINEEVEDFSQMYDEEEQRNSEYDGISRIASRMVENYSFKKLDKWKRKNKIITSLMRKGYSFSDIQEWIENNEEHFSD